MLLKHEFDASCSFLLEIFYHCFLDIKPFFFFLVFFTYFLEMLYPGALAFCYLDLF